MTSSLTGVAAALSGAPPARTAPSLFSLNGRVALITGGHRGIGLELALAFVESGAIVYCVDVPPQPDDDWLKVKKYAEGLSGVDKARLEYIAGDVTDQKGIWAIAEEIGNKEGRLDVCVCNAGILRGAECLDYEAEEFQKVSFLVYNDGGQAEPSL